MIPDYSTFVEYNRDYEVTNLKQLLFVAYFLIPLFELSSEQFFGER